MVSSLKSGGTESDIEVCWPVPSNGKSGLPERLPNPVISASILFGQSSINYYATFKHGMSTTGNISKDKLRGENFA